MSATWENSKGTYFKLTVKSRALLQRYQRARGRGFGHTKKGFDPSLAGTGSRWSEGQLRLRLVDASHLNAATIMPSYFRVDGLTRVGASWRGKPILSAEQIEDIVAYLVTLRN